MENEETTNWTITLMLQGNLFFGFSSGELGGTLFCVRKDNVEKS